jgi:adenylate kinase
MRKNHRNLIFITGVHGVGKTTLSKKIATKFNLLYLNAGEIIRDGKKVKAQNKSKVVSNIKDNQILLLEGLKKYTGHQWLLLDGHLTLINKMYEVEKIDAGFIHKIDPKGIILLTNKPAQILKNLKKRDSKDYDIKLIANQQDLEIGYAQQLAGQLKIGLLTVNGYNEPEIFKNLKGFLGDIIQ